MVEQAMLRATCYVSGTRQSQPTRVPLSWASRKGTYTQAKRKEKRRASQRHPSLCLLNCKTATYSYINMKKREAAVAVAAKLPRASPYTSQVTTPHSTRVHIAPLHLPASRNCTTPKNCHKHGPAERLTFEITPTTKTEIQKESQRKFHFRLLVGERNSDAAAPFP